MTQKLPRLLVYSPLHPEVMPYFERQFDDFEITADCSSAFDHAVMISSTDVYNVGSGVDHTEDSPLYPKHSLLTDEAAFLKACASRGVGATVLRCPHIVCTGMTGLPRQMVEKIYRGSYFHIKGDEQRLSVVHASDIALAGRKALDSGRVFIVTDGANPTFEQLAEALAYRMGDKRLYSISDRWARWRYNSAFYNQITNTVTFSCEAIKSTCGFEPTPVCDYLRNHVYDENSL